MTFAALRSNLRYSLALTLVSRGGGLVVSGILYRLLSLPDYAGYIFISAVSAFATIPLGGIGVAFQRAVVQAHAPRRLVFASIPLIAVMALATGGLALIRPGGGYQLAAASALFALGLFMQVVYSSLAVGLDRLRLVAGTEGATNLLQVAFCAVIAFRGDVALSTALLGLGACRFGGQMLLLLAIVRTRSESCQSTNLLVVLKDNSKLIVGYQVSALSDYALFTLPRLAALVAFGDVEAARIDLLMRVAQLASAIPLLLLPGLLRVLMVTAKDTFARLAAASLRLQLLSGLAAGAIVVAFGEPLAGLLFGDASLARDGVLPMLVIAVLGHSFTGVPNEALIAKGQLGSFLALQSFAALSLILLPLMALILGGVLLQSFLLAAASLFVLTATIVSAGVRVFGATIPVWSSRHRTEIICASVLFCGAYPAVQVLGLYGGQAVTICGVLALIRWTHIYSPYTEVN